MVYNILLKDNSNRAITISDVKNASEDIIVTALPKRISDYLYRVNLTCIITKINVSTRAHFKSLILLHKSIGMFSIKNVSWYRRASDTSAS